VQEPAVTKLEETIANLKYDKDGLIPAVVVDAENKDVLMVAHMNAEAVAKTVQTGRAHFWSRRRRKLWMKGQSSGHTQQVKAICVDCDMDTLLIQVIQRRAACHEGYRSCFYRKLSPDGDWEVIAAKVFDPEKVYGKGR
jgi:phosphoribosyl-AMP cyclohydrolase